MNAPLILGRQTFDGLGRQLSVEAAGCVTRFHYAKGQLPPSGNTLADGKHVEFTYEPDLNNRLLSVTPHDEATQRITYHPMGMPASASGALGNESFSFTTSGQPEEDIWTVDDSRHHTHWHYSLNGTPQGFVDALGKAHRRRFDASGRVQETWVGNVVTRYRYDALSRPVEIVVDDPDSAGSLMTTLTYDSLGREHTRTFTAVTLDGESTRATQTLGYSALDQMTSRTWVDDTGTGVEMFTYDLRGRLTGYAADPQVAPEDPFGNRIVRQTFTFNALNGHEKVVTLYADTSVDEARFTYADNNPVQVVKITHTHPAWPKAVTLTYDARGRVISDSLGRRMVWNSQDRLVEVRHANRSCQYGYTAHGRLADRTVDGTLSRSFYSGEKLTHETTGDISQQFCSGEQGLFAVSKVTAGIRQTTLLGADVQGSVRLETGCSVRTRRYSAHGVEPRDEADVPFGYAGQRHEPLTGWQILGDYRPYDPVLMCFLSPDSESPFGKGGINPYVYCAGDPVNRIDPDGHSWVAPALATVGILISIGVAVASFGAAATVIASIGYAGWAALTPSAAMIISAGALDAVSIGTGIAGLICEAAGADRNVGDVLGWVSLGTGLAAGALSGLAGSVAKLAARHPGRPAATLRRDASADVLFEKVFGDHDVAFHNQLWGRKSLKGFETHGTPEGYLMNAKGVFEPAANVAKREIAPRLANQETHRPLVLLACEGGSSGAAQEVANVLRRPVIGYDEVIHVLDPSYIRSFRYEHTRNGIMTNFPLKKLKGGRDQGLQIGPNYGFATPRTYYPV
ncbi:RHS repeat-associated core domain-containing protein [Pseudomonas sp. NFR16]|uniref:RHS repeat-associated core domain-containing protein n=1 Tax=Pseudomonas sp. NFR16 TaxID=1566248 RepID=UPI0008C1F7FE|nr:RHS repeat-associated core domain-containing protein [Pseudomonas sp. NFR16]SEJ13165.1 RHS repeat-associated core domain-containing protein [Pseudomonas sp. NFR16]